MGAKVRISSKKLHSIDPNYYLFYVQAPNIQQKESRQQLQIAQRSIEQAEENLRLNRDYYRAGTSKMSDLLEAQLLYQQSLDRRTDAFADYQNKLLEYRQATGKQKTL